MMPFPGRWKKKYVLWIAAAAIAVLAAAAAWFFTHRGEEALEIDKAMAGLYTGNEAVRKVDIWYASRKKPGLEARKVDIYLSASPGAQVKQAVLHLFKTPEDPDLVSVFPTGSVLRELFVDKEGLCVVDFALSVRLNHPGGTTAEYQTLYALVRTLTSGFSQVRQVQVMVNGEYAETLAGHLDISQPLTLADF